MSQVILKYQAGRIFHPHLYPHIYVYTNTYMICVTLCIIY